MNAAVENDSPQEAHLRGFISAWLGQIAKLDYRDLAARQDPPFASLTFGAAGIAYALWRAGRALADGGLVVRARGWAEAAARHAGGRVALQPPGGMPRGASLAYDRDGIRFVRALIAGAGGDERVGAFLRGVRATRRRPAELLFGTAGQLAGTVVLLEATGDARLAALADQQARLLLDDPTWAARPDLAFAHGRAGIFHALLRWRRATGAALPRWFWPALDHTAAQQPAWQRPRRRALRPTWCNGAAGMALLWTAAFEERGDRRTLRLARAAAHTSLTATSVAGGDLCCGLAGRAYAALAVERVAPGEGFRAGALELAVRAVAHMRGRWPNGLLKGYPGLVCLALDLVHEPVPRGFPLVEG
jgi:hypothetical protein